jgi:hypothetical protein
MQTYPESHFLLLAFLPQARKLPNGIPDTIAFCKKGQKAMVPE